MGPGGPRGLQILRSGVRVRGGFDSHTFPPIPCFALLTVLLLLLLPSVSLGADTDIAADKAAVSPFWSSARSLVVPGWGQLRNGSEFRGGVVFGLQTYFLLRYRVAERRGRFYDEERSAENPRWDSAYLDERVADSKDTRGDMVWWSVITLLYSVIDAYVDAHMVGFDEQIEEVERVTFSIEPNGGEGAAFVLSSHF